jgi:hypothetical protein
MKKSLTALAVAATLVIASVAAPQSAQARNGRNAAAIFGGLAAGALVGAAIAGGPRYYGSSYYYGPPRRHYYRQRCWWTRERYWNGYRWRSHRIRVCD